MATEGDDEQLLQRFLSSMVMDFDKWHDGTGYEVDLLERLSPLQRAVAERTLIDHSPRDWRDVEALARLDTPAARKAIAEALHSSDGRVRREARRHAPQAEDQCERKRHLIRSLEHDELFAGLGQAIDEAAEFHPPGVVDALFRGALARDGEAAVHFAALLLFIHGKAAEPFDWAHRPFFLRFASTDPAERRAVFDELCKRLGVDSARYTGT